MTKAATSKTWVRSIFAGTGKRWSDPDAPLSATVNTFRALPNPVVDGSEWSTGENKGVRDNVTGDLVLIRWTQTNNAFVLYSSQDNGITWARLATDVSNPDPGATYQYANCLFGLAQDSSGAVHGITCGKQGDQRYFYIRFALTRSGGHVTGFSIAQNVIPLAFHARTGVDIRGNIYVIKQDGAERLLFTYGINIAANALDVNIFAVRSTTITPTLAAHFVGLDGTGSEIGRAHV